ncbi:hypothetical protein BKA80DRAFT_258939 [Phyllosticta citrichinensis]
MLLCAASVDLTRKNSGICGAYLAASCLRCRHALRALVAVDKFGWLAVWLSVGLAVGWLVGWLVQVMGVRRYSTSGRSAG